MSHDPIDPIDYREITRRVEKRLRERRAFVLHLVVFIISNLFFWIVWWFVKLITLGSGMFSDGVVELAISSPWPLLLMFAWGIGLAAHAMSVYFKSDAAARRRDREIQREIERERARLGLDSAYTKPKREHQLRLSEDGELIIDDDEPKAAVRRRDS